MFNSRKINQKMSNHYGMETISLNVIPFNYIELIYFIENIVNSLKKIFKIKSNRNQ
jgi:hypothetical protein